MHSTDGSLQERALAVTQVVIPHTDKALVKTQLTDFRQVRQKTLTPVIQGQGVVMADVMKLRGDHAGMLSQMLAHHRHAGQETAREDIAFDEVDLIAGMLVALIRHRDGLQYQFAIRF